MPKLMLMFLIAIGIATGAPPALGDQEEEEEEEEEFEQEALGDSGGYGGFPGVETGSGGYSSPAHPPSPTPGYGGWFGGSGDAGGYGGFPDVGTRGGTGGGAGGGAGGGGFPTAGWGVVSDSTFWDGASTRIFAGPKEYPPQNFGAYAIVAFKSGPDANDRDRYDMFCHAYIAAIPESSDVSLPLNQQLVTVWPLSVPSSQIFDEVGQENQDGDVCTRAVERYGHTMALQAIRDARVVSNEARRTIRERRGPFLFAWNPAVDKGDKDALILRMDLSNVELPYQAKRRFEFWVQQIETHPELWLDGWQEVPINNRIGETADIYGKVIIDFLRGRGG